LRDNNARYVDIQESLSPALLEQILAPIALYPDSLLSQILVASTYPLEVIEAARWRQDNRRLSERKALQVIEYKEWDPSVKALAPFTELITKLSSDLDWLQLVGDAFLQNEYQVLASVQELRQKAYYKGSLADNYYYDVIIDNGNIIIESINKEFVYVPHYDSRAVYGDWKWKDYQPVYWKAPSHYRLHAGFYWSSKFYIRPTIFFGGFRWGLRNLVINKHFYEQPYSRNTRHRNIGVSNYRKWKHNPVHRRGVIYSRINNKKAFRKNYFDYRSKIVKQSGSDIYDKRRVVGNRTFSRDRTGVINNDQRRFDQRGNNRGQQFDTRGNGKVGVVRRDTRNGRSLDIKHNNSRQKIGPQLKKKTVKTTSYKSPSLSKKQPSKTSIKRHYNSNKKIYKTNKLK